MIAAIEVPKIDTGRFSFQGGKKGGAKAWEPQPGPQTQAYTENCFEILYGGAAGGGKTDLLLGLARYKHKHSLLLRRTFPDAERSLIVRSLDFYGDQKSYNGSKHVWKVDNRRIEIGHLEYDKDVYQYQGAAYDLIGFDELTQFTKTQYEYLLSRARTINKNQRVQIISCSNPGGEGNEWVMERWAAWLDETYPRPAKPGELRWYKRTIDGKEIETERDDPDAMSRTFIPARLKDNQYLGEDYRKTLNLLPEPIRSQLLNGDWKAGLVDDAYQVIPRAWVKAAMARWKPDGGIKPLTAVGGDIARGGDDKTVFAPLHENWFDRLCKYPGKETPDGQSVAGLLEIQLSGSDAMGYLDVIGVGSSAYDISALRELNVVPVNFAERSDSTDKSGQLRFVNVRAECYWAMREALDPNSGENVALPPDSELLGDLVASRWVMQTNGIKIESKDDIKKRIGRSPDSGDAVVIAWRGRMARPLLAFTV